MAYDKLSLLAALKELGLLMELAGENTFRVRAFANASRTLEGIEGQPADWLASGVLENTKGIGKGMLERVEEWVECGELEVLNNYRANIPAGLVEMHSIPSLGPKKIKLLWEERGIDSVEKLEEAARAGALGGLAGFGQKTVDKILLGIEQRRKYSARHHVSTGLDTARLVSERLRALPQTERLEVAGSLRRHRETVKDIDFLVISDDPAPIMEAFTSMPEVEQVVIHGETKSSVLLAGGVPVDLRVVPEESFAAALMYFTGSKEHNTELRGLAKKQGMKLMNTGFKNGEETPLAGAEEKDLYAHLGLDWVAPELREGRGEVEAATEGALPELIEPGDVKGVLHCHSTFSDGKNSIGEMVGACQALGYSYFGLCDHSQTAAYAGGLKEGDLQRQADEIDALNAKLDGFRIFKGIESDILGDGALDYPDAVLDRLDFVVASIHSRMTMPGDEMTARICHALEHPATRILGHPTGRLLLKREPYALDMEKVLQTAAENKVVIEINANPWRLDLDWTWIKQAKRMGCRFAINPDAHTTDQIEFIPLGVGIARKGWLTKEDVINTMDAEAFEAWLGN